MKEVFTARWVVQTGIQLFVLIVALVTFFMQVQASIDTAILKADEALTVAQAHSDKTDIHMPLESSIETFVPRKEVEASLTAINENLTGIKGEIVSLREAIYRINMSAGGSP